MTAMTYQNLSLAWHPENKRDRRYTIFSIGVLALFVSVGLFFGSIEVPEEPRKERVEVPERIANFILEKPKPQPKPKEIEEPKPIPKPKPKVKRKRPEKEIELTETQKVARKKAEESGLLALSDELSDLIDTSSIDSMVGKKLNKNNQVTKVASADTSLLTADASKGSDGVNSGEILSRSSGGVKLDAQQRKIAQQLLTARASSGKGKAVDKSDSKPRIGNYRSEEDIAYVMDQNKSNLHTIYRRARRNNPGIKGKIVLEITISPAGKVLDVIVASSELNDPGLESRIVARIKQFNFGAKNVKTVTVTYPVEFLPS
ncbi:AgmX/PglI C-terminal domain-containing protein [Aliikangiella coralliicola]|uniref:TonB family protein n=1 Tax=Aliikangiella coralliicola TaxID=2592383 RepID=A0A545U8T0_9GAMM|nr:AgmX/PglI C-terminal domain-containing protein [Aliikangiella coralliicola]TQV85880.1 TonB family protein [Aliikangiella coralliicola]